MYNLVSLSWLLVALGIVFAFPDGAPDIACATPIGMTPAHMFVAPQDAKDSDYQLLQDKAAFEPNYVVTVRLSAQGLPFKGFMVKALDQHGNQTGHFLPGDRYQPMKACAVATHVARTGKRAVTMR